MPWNPSCITLLPLCLSVCLSHVLMVKVHKLAMPILCVLTLCILTKNVAPLVDITYFHALKCYHFITLKHYHFNALNFKIPLHTCVRIKRFSNFPHSGTKSRHVIHTHTHYIIQEFPVIIGGIFLAIRGLTVIYNRVILTTTNTTKEANRMTVRTNSNWLDYLPYNVRLRLVECRTTKTDLPILLDAKWRWTQDTSHYIGYTKEDILASILYLLDNNGLGRITGLTMAEWHDLTN